MVIKEGSKIKLIEGYDDNVVIDEIIANEDIEIEGGGYAILIRTEGRDTNNLFESDSIEKVDEENYVIKGFFKDALMILKNNKSVGLFQSWMDISITHNMIYVQ